MKPTKPIVIVMVDDNLDEIFLARRQVRGQGIINQFVSERYSENVLNTIGELATDHDAQSILVLLDVNMPRLDGFETLRLIRANETFGAVPVIMFSASDDEDDMNDAMALGADGYLVKPFSISAFISALGGLPTVRFNLFPPAADGGSGVRVNLVQ